MIDGDTTGLRRLLRECPGFAVEKVARGRGDHGGSSCAGKENHVRGREQTSVSRLRALSGLAAGLVPCWAAMLGLATVMGPCWAKMSWNLGFKIAWVLGPTKRFKEIIIIIICNDTIFKHEQIFNVN